jgi:hypothetical protein
MTTTKLRNLVTEAVSLGREIEEKTERLKALKADLITAAGPRADTATAGGGRSWIAEGADGCIARVTFPAPKLKASIAGEGSAIEKVRKLAGRFFSLLFDQVPAYKPAANFRQEAEALLGKDARKLIRACETSSSPSVSFETKENNH